MRIKPTLSRFAEFGITLTAIATLVLAGCGGDSSSSSGSSSASTTPLIITPSLGQLYRGRVVVTGHNSTSRSYSIVSGVPTVTADIAGMTAPLLIELKGDPNNGNELIFFDEALGTIASSVTTSSASSVLAVVPSITGISASGIGVTPLTNMAAATVANSSGVVNIANLSVASAVGANTAGLAMAQKLAGNTTITDVLTPPTPSKVSGATLGTTAADEYAKILHTLASLPTATYGNNAFQKSEYLRSTMASTGKPPVGFDAHVSTANTTVLSAGGYNGTAPIPSPAFADFKAMMDIAAQAMPASAVTATAPQYAQQAAMRAAMESAFNAVSGVSATGIVTLDQKAINNAISAGQGFADTATQSMLALSSSAVQNPEAIQAAMLQALQAAASGLSFASAIANTQNAAFGIMTPGGCPTGQTLNSSMQCVAPPPNAGSGGGGFVTFSPRTGATGTSVVITGTIHGSNLSAAAQILFTGPSPSTAFASGTISSKSEYGISASVPASLSTGSYIVSVIYPGGEIAGDAPFVVTAGSGATTGGGAMGLTFSPAFNGISTFANSAPTKISSVYMYSQNSYQQMFTLTYFPATGSIPESLTISTTSASASQSAGVNQVSSTNNFIGTCSLAVDAFYPTCSNAGIAFNKAAGTISFTNTPMAINIGSTAPQPTAFTVNGTLTFTPF